MTGSGRDGETSLRRRYGIGWDVDHENHVRQCNELASEEFADDMNDRFIQILNTSLSVIGLEFVFSNLCMTVSENLLSLSLLESPYPFHFQSCVSEFLEH